MTLTDATLVALALLTAFAAWIDWRTRHIPNPLVLIGLVVGSALHLLAAALPARAAGVAWPGALAGAALEVALGLLLCAAGPLWLFRIHAMGGGDVKLLAVVGASVGPSLGLGIELCAFVLLALYAPLSLVREGLLLEALGNTAALLLNPFLPEHRRREVTPACCTEMPFGPAIFCATLLVAAARWWP